MRSCLLTLTGMYLLLFMCLPSRGQISSTASSSRTQKSVEDKDPIAIVELGAATSWNLTKTGKCTRQARVERHFQDYFEHTIDPAGNNM